MNIKKFFKKFFDSTFGMKNAYRIISKTANKRTYYLIQKRSQMSWEYVKDSTTVGYNKMQIEYPAYFETMEAAEARVNKEMDKDALREEVTKVEKVFTLAMNFADPNTL